MRSSITIVTHTTSASPPAPASRTNALEIAEDKGFWLFATVIIIFNIYFSMLRQPGPCCEWAATAMDYCMLVLPGRPPTPPDREPAARGRGAVRRRYPPDARKPRLGSSSSSREGRPIRARPIPASAARRPRSCRPAAGERCRPVSRPPQALHPDRAQRLRPNEQHGQHPWSEERAERPGAPPTVH